MFGRIVWFFLRKTGVAKRLPSKAFVKIQYFCMTGKILHLNPPVDFNEKIQWMKLYYHNPILSVCADKYAVREFVKDRIGEAYLNECYGVYDTVEEIDFKSLPKSFVIKGTHGSAMNLLCKDKEKLDVEAARAMMKKWLTFNFYEGGREWHYRDIKPRLLCEKFIVDPDHSELQDYKMLTFSGEVKYIWVEYFKGGRKFLNFYDSQWRFHPEKTDGLPNGEAADVPKPICLDEMLSVAEKLSSGFPQCRVDFYVVGGSRLVFGELTFTCGNGCNKFRPQAFCEELGGYIKLPKEML